MVAWSVKRVCGVKDPGHTRSTDQTDVRAFRTANPNFAGRDIRLVSTRSGSCDWTALGTGLSIDVSP